MRIIIAGSRSFLDAQRLKYEVDKLLYNLHTKGDITIISGGARGADRLGEKYAEHYGIKVEKFPADWNKYGKSAGYRRNKEMAEVGDVLIAFWDGESNGTKHMIELSVKYGLLTKVIYYNE